MRGLLLRALRAYRRAGTTTVMLPVLVGSLGVLLVSGVPLIWLYHPDRHAVLQGIHIAAASVCLVATMIILGSRLWAALRPRPAAAGAGAVAALVTLVVLAGGTGTTLAWVNLRIPVERLASGDHPTQGVVVGLSPEVRQIATTDDVMDRSTYVFNATLHLLVLPALLALPLWRIDRRRRADGRPGPGEPGDAPAEGEDGM